MQIDWEKVIKIAHYNCMHNIPSFDGTILEEECAEYMQAICKSRRNGGDFDGRQYSEAIDLIIAALVFFATAEICESAAEIAIDEKLTRVANDPGAISHS